MTGGKIALLIIGIILLVGFVVLMAGGAALMWVSSTLESSSPAFAPREISLRKADAYAIVTEPFQIDWYDESQSEGWGLRDFVAVRVEAENRDSSKRVFIDIASETDVEDYLNDVLYYEVLEWSSSPYDDPAVEYQPHSGSLAPSDPASETFWTASAHGPSRQTLDWKPEMGRWVLVFMNEDGSAGIDVSGALGSKLPWLFWLGLALLPLGIVVMITGVIMVYFAAKRPKRPLTPVSVPTLGTS